MRPPNILLINCDDLGYGDLGCYGSTVNDTPNLDRLATEGLRFTEFYQTSSICSPSRAAMMTGCYPQRVGFTTVLHPAVPEGIAPGERTIANVLRDRGYRTRIIGKWHLGDQPEYMPTRFGFDGWFGLPYSNDMGRQLNNGNKGVPLPLMRDEEVIQEQPDQTGLTERYVEDAVRFMRESGDQPFFLYLAHMYVHLPLFVPERFAKVSRNGRYGGAVACIDWAWGVLDRELQRLGLAEDTIVVFTSDNGSRLGNGPGSGGSNAPLRGSKGTSWEGGFRLPCLMRWPGRLAAGRQMDGVAASVDLLPTFAALTGAEAPTDRVLDGQDLSAWLLGERPESPRQEMVYSIRGGNISALRQGKWKLHAQTYVDWRKPPEPTQELYDLEADVAEANNVATEHPEIVAAMEARIEAWRDELGHGVDGRVGTGVRPCGVSPDPQPLCVYDPTHPYMIAEYDLAERG